MTPLPFSTVAEAAAFVRAWCAKHGCVVDLIHSTDGGSPWRVEVDRSGLPAATWFADHSSQAWVRAAEGLHRHGGTILRVLADVERAYAERGLSPTPGRRRAAARGHRPPPAAR